MSADCVSGRTGSTTALLQGTTWHPAGMLALSVVVLPDLIEVALPRVVEPSLPLTLGLFMKASLDVAANDAATAASLFCTSAAVAWRCLDRSNASNGEGAVSVGLPQPEWSGQYVVMLVANDCNPFAASALFKAGPPAAVTSPWFHVLEVPRVFDPQQTNKWWPMAMDRRCVEYPRYLCPELTIHVTNRGEGAHVGDALLLLPVSAAMAPQVRGSIDGWRDLLSKYNAGMAAPMNVLGSIDLNVTMHLTSPLLRSAYLAVLLSGAPGAADPVVAVSEIFTAGRSTLKYLSSGSEMEFRNTVINVGVRPDRPRRPQQTSQAADDVSPDVLVSLTSPPGVLTDTVRFAVVEIDVIVRIGTFAHFTDLPVLLEMFHMFHHSLTLARNATDTSPKTRNGVFLTGVVEMSRILRPAIEAGVISYFELANFMKAVMAVAAPSALSETAAHIASNSDEYPSSVLLPVRNDRLSVVSLRGFSRRRTLEVPPMGAADGWSDGWPDGVFGADGWPDGWPLLLSTPFYVAPHAAACLDPMPPLSPPSPPRPASRSAQVLLAVGMSIATAALLRLLWTKRCRKPCCRCGEDGIALMAMQSPCDSTKSSPVPCQPALESRSEGPSPADVCHSSADRLSEGPGRSPVVLEKELGTGGFGTVWQGQWMHSAVAVKKFKMTEKGVQDVMHKFDREVKTLRALRHPNICSFFDTCLVDGALAIVLELLTGGTLGEYLGIRKGTSHVEPAGLIEFSDSSTDTKGEALAPRGQAAPNRPGGWRGVPPGELLRLAKDVALGLHYLHVNNVTHLDVKLGNVMVHHGQAKLCDFGISTLQTATAAAEQQLSRTFSSVTRWSQNPSPFPHPFTSDPMVLSSHESHHTLLDLNTI